MFDVVIVEDEQPILKLMEIVISREAAFNIRGSFRNPFDALGQLAELNPDVVFLDVEMPEINGLELARQIKQRMEHVHIVFTTAYKQYALEAFDVQALDYIVKPVNDKAIGRVKQRLMNQRAAPTAAASEQIYERVRCLGGFEIRSSSSERMHFPTRKTEELFAYFLCNPDQEINKWQLAELLWSDMDGERASHNLHSTIYRLKKVLDTSGIKMSIHKTSEGYMLQTARMSYDVKMFQQEAGMLTDQPLNEQQAKKLFRHYQGPLLDGKPYVWKITLEERFRLVYERIVLELVKDELGKGNRQIAEQYIHTSMVADPGHLKMHSNLLQMLVDEGDMEGFTRLFKVLERECRERLGEEVSEHLQLRDKHMYLY